MKLRTVIVTVALLAVLSAIVAFVRRPASAPSSDPRINQPVVDASVLEKAAKLRLSDAGKSVELVRQADGTWRVPSYYDMPADFSKLASFVGSLSEAKLQRLVTSNAERLARLEFKDTKIELIDSANKPVTSVTLGKTAEVGGGRYVRFGNEQKAYLANLAVYLDVEPKNWANAELYNVKADDVSKIEIPFNGGSTVTFSRTKKDEPWTATPPQPGQQVKSDKIATLLNSLGTLRFSDTATLDAPNVTAAKANMRTVKLTTFDNKTLTIALGRKPEEKKIKPPAPATDGKSGPAALGTVADLNKEKSNERASDDQKADAPGANTPPGSKPLAPEFETIPAGPVYAFASHSEAAAPINSLMQKRAFQVSDYVFTSLPATPGDLFEPVPSQAPAAPKP